jgi:hypothetical protein
VHYLTLKEQQAFAENKFAVLDVHTTNEGQSNVNEEVCKAKAEDVESGFGRDNK